VKYSPKESSSRSTDLGHDFFSRRSIVIEFPFKVFRSFLSAIEAAVEGTARQLVIGLRQS